MVKNGNNHDYFGIITSLTVSEIATSLALISPRMVPSGNKYHYQITEG